MTPVYAAHGSAEFNARLHETLRRLAADVNAAMGNDLVALVLGGGYGRGEGAVVRRGGLECAYNDLDLFLVARRKGVATGALDAVRVRYAAELGIEFDISRPLTPAAVAAWPPALMWFDLLHGHVVLSGPDDVFTIRAPAALRRPLPPIEATHLLLNRGAGLLWAMRTARGVEPPPGDDFVRRNYWKCAQALGDALLIAYGRYATPYAGRDGRLAGLAAERAEVGALGLAALYADALKFKFSPDDLPAGPVPDAHLAELARRWAAVFLLIEQRRTGRAWPGLAAYCAWTGLREPRASAPLQWPRTIGQNMRLGVFSWRYPRERLYRALPALLAPAGAASSAWAEESAGFLAVWRRFN